MEARKEHKADNPIDNMGLENLPEHLIHRIMHLLPYKEVAKFNVLSKSLHSCWLSFPILRFSFKSMFSSEVSCKTFFNNVQKTLQLRGPYIKGCLHNLSLSYTEHNRPNSYHYPGLFDVLLNFAIENNVQELNFDLRMRHDDYRNYAVVNWNYDSLRHLFSSQFLTILKLKGVKVPLVDAFITCPKLEELVIKWCHGFRTINISSPSTLKNVEISYCLWLKEFQILLEGQSMNNFEYDEPQQCALDLKIRYCPNLQVLKLIDTNYSLKKLSLDVYWTTSELSEMVIDVPNLLKFNYICGSERLLKLITAPKCSANIVLSLPCVMWDFLSCFNTIKDLSIYGYEFEDMIFAKPHFQPVNVSSLYDLEHVKVGAMCDPLPSGPNLIKFLNNLLKLVLKPRTIALYSESTKTTRTLKFKYGAKVETRYSKVGDCCYNNADMKCWRHYEVEIEFEGYNESAIEDLNKFFARKLHRYGIYRDSANSAQYMICYLVP